MIHHHLQLLWQAVPAKSSSEVEAQILAKIAAIAAPERYNAAKGGATKVWSCHLHQVRLHADCEQGMYILVVTWFSYCTAGAALAGPYNVAETRFVVG